MTIKKNKYKDSTAWRNFVRMKLLTLLSSFQVEVSNIRRGFAIPKYGYPCQSFTELNDYLKENKKIRLFVGEMPPGFYEMPPENPFKDRVTTLKEKFRLPYHFVSNIFCGVPYYILTNKIVVPENNWELDSEFTKSDKKISWIAIKAYAPLNGMDLKEAVKELRKQQKNYFFPEITVPRRIKTRFARDIRIFERMFPQEMAHSGRKMFDGYLSYVYKETKKNSYYAREFKKLKRIRKEEVYTRPTSKQIGREEKIKPDTARKAVERLNTLSQEFFGQKIIEA